MRKSTAMSSFFSLWLQLWCFGVLVFGAVLAGGALEATSGPVRLLFDFLGPSPTVLDAQARFSLGVLGAVSIGWALTTYGAILVAIDLGDRGAKLWKWILVGVLAWFVIDTPLSIITGYWMNAIPNVVLLLTFLWPVYRSGMLR